MQRNRIQTHPHERLAQWIKDNEPRLKKEALAYFQKCSLQKEQKPSTTNLNQLIESYLASFKQELRRELRHVLPSSHLAEATNKIVSQMVSYFESLKKTAPRAATYEKHVRLVYILTGLCIGITALIWIGEYAHNALNIYDVAIDLSDTAILLSGVGLILGIRNKITFPAKIKPYLSYILDKISLKSAAVNTEPHYPLANLPKARHVNSQNNTSPCQKSTELIAPTAPQTSLGFRFPHSTPAQLMQTFYYSNHTCDRTPTQNPNAQSNNAAHETKHEDITDARGNTYVAMALEGHYTRYNPNEILDKISAAREPPNLAQDINESIFNRNINRANTGSRGITQLSKSEKNLRKYTYKLRLNETRVQPEVKLRPPTIEEQNLSDKIKHVFTLRRLTPHT